MQGWNSDDPDFLLHFLSLLFPLFACLHVSSKPVFWQCARLRVQQSRQVGRRGTRCWTWGWPNHPVRQTPAIRKPLKESKGFLEVSTRSVTREAPLQAQQEAGMEARLSSLGRRNSTNLWPTSPFSGLLLLLGGQQDPENPLLWNVHIHFLW